MPSIPSTHFVDCYLPMRGMVLWYFQSAKLPCNTFVFINFTLPLHRCFFLVFCFYFIFVCVAIAWFSVSVFFVVAIASIYLCIYFAVIKFYALVALALWQLEVSEWEREREEGGKQRLNRIRNRSAWKYAALLKAAILKHSNTMAARIIALWLSICKRRHWKLCTLWHI